MAYEHTNRKGTTYHLHRRERKGKTRYVFSRKIGAGAVDELPAGYEVRESVNGQVSLAKSKERVIRTAEEALVRKILPAQCQFEIKGREITLFEPANGAGGGMAEVHPLVRATFAAQLAKNARYEPVMRLTLVDTDDRQFEITRWRYSGEGGWMYPLAAGKLAPLLKKFTPHIGKQSFFNLM